MNRRSTQLLLAATVFAAPALLSACGGDATADQSADDRGAGAGAPARTVSVEDLLTDADTVYSDGADWFRLGTGDETLSGNGDLAHPCLAQGLSGTGASEVLRADFELRNTADPSVEVTGDRLTQLVGQYDDAAAARAAYEKVATTVAACEDRPAAITEFRSLDERDVAIDDATAQIVDALYGPVPKEVDPYGDSAHIMETGLAVSGDRLVVLTSVIIGQDYNFLEEDGGTPVNQMLPTAVDRLR